LYFESFFVGKSFDEDEERGLVNENISSFFFSIVVVYSCCWLVWDDVVVNYSFFGW